jgi:DNA methylase
MRSPTTAEALARVPRFHEAGPVMTRINWNFSPITARGFAARPFDCRRHHWYPATFIPEIPYTLIELLSSRDATVYDPFAGTGTTIFQALQLGRVPYATELCRVTVDFMRSLWILLRPSTEVIDIYWRVEDLLSRFNPRVNYSARIDSRHVLVSKLRPWFSPKTFQQVMFLTEAEQMESDAATKAALRICISNLLKSACAQDRGWGCVADNVLPRPAQKAKRVDAVTSFRRKLRLLMTHVAEFREKLSPQAKRVLQASPNSHVIRSNVVEQTQVARESIDLVVTSPPYPNMTDYCLSQRLSYYWLGVDPSEDLSFEIGARRKRSAADSLEKYREKMKRAQIAIAATLKSGGYACFIMPGFEGDQWNNAARKQSVQDCLAHLHTCGLVRQQELTRMLPLRRRHHNQKWTTLERENIYIFSKLK